MQVQVILEQMENVYTWSSKGFSKGFAVCGSFKILERSFDMRFSVEDSDIQSLNWTLPNKQFE